MNPSVQHDDARFLDLLRRWQSGDFTRADERELKSLTDSDDFRREAMEGFMSLPAEDHDARLLSLRQKVRLRSGAIEETARRVVLFRIWAAAAAIALLISAIWFLPVWPDKESPVATRQEAPADERASQAAPLSNDSEQKSGETEVSQPPASGSAAPRRRDELPASSVESDDLAVTMEEVQTDQALAEAPAPAVSNSTSAPVLQDKAENVFASKPPSDQSGGAPGAALKDLAKAKKSMPSRATDSTWHKTDVKPEMDAARKEAREAEEPAVSEPAGGWDAFNEYLRQNARLPLEARSNNISGTVRLQFSVNANGEPQNFITLRSLGYGCDEEAVRLVKNWDWLRGKSPLVTVEIRFVR